MSGHDVGLTTRDQLDRAIATASILAPHQVPVLREVRAGRLAAVQPTREAELSLRRLKSFGRPVMVIVGDDDYVSTGPDGWRCAQRVIGWAHQILIHGAAGGPEEYGAAALAAQITGRFLLIECCSDNVEAWFHAAKKWSRRAVCQRLVTAPGVRHPMPFDGGKLQ